jgi:replicative DNA helicase
MLLSHSAIQAAISEVTVRDFYDTKNAATFDAIRSLHAEGEIVDVTTTADRLRRRGELEKVGGPAEVLSMQVHCPATTSARRYAAIVTETAMMRLLIATGARITELGYDHPVSVADAVSEAKDLLASVEAGVPQVDVEISDLDQVCERPEPIGDVVIPDLLHRQDRALIVAGEGLGKSVLLRMLAVMAAQGIHPFRYQPIPPARSLIVDLENPEATIRRTCRPMLRQARISSRGYLPDRCNLFHRPEGLDIRTRSGLAALDAALAQSRPDLVCVGPLYKLYRSAKGEQAEDVAMDVTGRLDDLRIRHGFALVLEHHAPHGQGGTRDMRPFGSSIWQRWPEFGPALVPIRRNDRSALAWSEWRAPREVRDWPTRLHRGQVWPWEASFETTQEAF